MAAVVAAALAAAPAQAAEVTVVDGDHAVKRDDPFVPARSASDLMPAPGRRGEPVAQASAGSTARGRRAVQRALRRALRAKKIKRPAYRRYKRQYLLARRTLRRLRGARRDQLAYVVYAVERMGLAGQLIASRLPVVLTQLDRNRRYWPKLPYPASGDRVSFKGSEVLYQYFPGRGLQLHPLSTFKKANLIHGACVRDERECDPEALARLLDEMTRFAVWRSPRFVAWEYMFHFGGGSPPWMSGMAQATALQAYARAARLLDKPEYVQTARRGLGAFETRPPTGVRTTGPGGGVHYLQYSFSPRLYIFNAFLQSLIGLHDFGKLTGDKRARELFREAEPEARAEVPLSDVGDWSRYSYAGAESTRDYHELLREFLQSMCSRRLGRLYCDYARRYRGYQVDPPELELLGPATATADEPVAIRFSLSKLSAVELKIYRGERLVHSALASFRLGTHAFTWTPAVPGTVRVELAAKELRTGLGKKDRAAGQIEIDP